MLVPAKQLCPTFFQHHHPYVLPIHCLSVDWFVVLAHREQVIDYYFLVDPVEV